MKDAHLPWLLLFTLATPLHAKTEKVDEIYQTYCAACHGKQLEGGVGPSFVDQTWIYDNSAQAMANLISKGTSNGMPSFGQSLSDKEIRGVIIYLKEQAAKAQPTATSQLLQGQQKTLHHNFSLQPVAEFSGVVWAIEQRPDLSLLVTLRDQELWLINGSEKREIKGLPEIWRKGQGGLLDVALHPDYPKQPWVYLTYSESLDSKSGMTTLARGQIREGRWLNQQRLFQSDPEDHSSKGPHFGSRIVFQGEHLYFTIGDRGDKERAQQLDKPNGKVHRLMLDGAIPNDNPFPKSKYPSTWSYGHRNPQGLTLNPNTGELWLAEHGPRGGDELNLIEKSKNYGWPEITYGMNYNGTPITGNTAQEGMEQPVTYWVPSLAVSAVEYYQGNQFPKWRDHLLLASLAAQELRLLTLEGQRVVSQEILLKNQGRIRDVVTGRDGFIYLALEERSTNTSRIVRLVPVT